MNKFMQILAVIVLLLVTALPIAKAQNSTTLNNLSTDQETTISIKKGAPIESNKKLWELQTGTAEVAGDPQLMDKEARKSWKTACAEWKAELKELNQENKVLVLNCNSPKCHKTGGPTGVEVLCQSTATYSLKVKVSE